MDEAEEACNNRKAHLVSILDANENAKVQQIAADNNVRQIQINNFSVTASYFSLNKLKSPLKSFKIR